MGITLADDPAWSVEDFLVVSVSVQLESEVVVRACLEGQGVLERGFDLGRWCTNRNWHGATVPTTGTSSTGGVRSWAAHVGHRIQHVAGEQHFDRSPQGAIVGSPVPDVVLRLVRGMDSRFHPSSLNCRLEPSHRIRAPTPLPGLHCILGRTLCARPVQRVEVNPCYAASRFRRV